jgi:hypothetical protein
MKTISMLVALVLCAGCAHGGDEDTSVDAGDSEEASEGSTAPLCCQVDQDITDGSLWQNYTYSCSANEPPWICDGEWDCNSPNCHLNDPCHGFNGDGVVVSCRDQ